MMAPRTNVSTPGQGMTEYVLVISLVVILLLAIALYVFPGIRKIYRDALSPDVMNTSQATLSAGLYD